MTATPSTAEELEEVLSDQAKFNERVKTPEDLRNFTKDYVKAQEKNAADTNADIAVQVQRELANLMKDGGFDKPPVPLTPTTAAVTTGQDVWNNGQRIKIRNQYNKLAPGAGLDGEFQNTWDFFRAVVASGNATSFPGRNELLAKLSKGQEILNSFGSTVPQDGGFLIDETTRSEILQVALETAIVRPRASVIPMSTLRLPMPAVDSTTNNGSILGGMIAYWTEEAAALTASQAAFQRIVLDAKKLTAYTEVPNELLADASAFPGFLDMALPTTIAWYEDVAFFNGTGAGEPLGFMNAPALLAVAKESGQAAATILWENIVKAYSRMLPSSLSKAVWVAAPDTFPELATMALSVGTGGSAIWLNNGAEGAPVTILGRPVIFTEKAKTLGSQGDISFVDLSYYLIGDRQTMQGAQSEHYKFANDMTAFRVIERLDGRPWIQSAITPQNNSSNTLSPFVQIAAR